MELSNVQSDIFNSDGNLIIVAGAGSGKTRVLVEKYIDVFDKNPDLAIDQVVAMTFTEKAAREMKERVTRITQERLKADPENKIYQKIKRDISFSRISTIHSFCARILRESALYVNIDPDFKIVSGISASRRTSKFVESYIVENVKEIKALFKLDPTLKFADLRNWLLDSINSRASATSREEIVNGELKALFERHVTDLITAYEKMEKEDAILSFEDLLIFTRDFLRENHDLRERYSNYFRYIFVDEFQDTNRVQSEIIELLRNSTNKVWYIGDPKQSIYAFRGADVDVFLEITEKAKEKNVLLKEMNENHRSKPNLVRFYNEFFSRIFDGRIKYSPQIVSGEDTEKRVILLENPGSSDMEMARFAEAQAICGIIDNFIGMGKNLSDVAILLRQTTNIWIIENELVKYGIPYHVIGGKNFFNKKEVLAIRNLMNVILDPYDKSAMVGLLLSPFFDMEIDEILKLKIEYRSIYDGLKEKYPHIHNLIERLTELKNITDTSKLLRMAIRETNYLGKIALEKDGDKRIANVIKFIDSLDTLDIPAWDISGINSVIEKGFGEDEQEAAVLSEKENVVKIMTIHKAKGLEFPVVILAQMNTSSKNGKKIQENLEEEKRLLYVGMTRAMEYLVLSKEINFKENKENVWTRALAQVKLEKDKEWNVPKDLEELVRIEKSRMPKIHKKIEEKFDFEDKYLQSPKFTSEPQTYNVTELFEEMQMGSRQNYGNVAHEILEKVGPYTLEEVLNMDFAMYTKEMVDEVKTTLYKFLHHPLVKEMEDSTFVSEFAIEINIPSVGNFIGKIDKITEKRVIDFKYANYSPTKVKDYEFQIKFYMMAYKRLTNQRLNGSIFFLKDGRVLDVEYPDEDKLLEEIKKRVSDHLFSSKTTATATPPS